MKNILVTGSAGFIATNFINYWSDKYPKDNIIGYDKRNPNDAYLLRARDSDGRVVDYRYICGDITDLKLLTKTLENSKVDCIINFAAESHNSYAIINPNIFFKTNIIGTQTVLEAARLVGTPRINHISTCEVFGDLELDSPDKFAEDSPYRPRTPYNSSKAGADLAVRAYYLTYGLNVTISNCCNNYGPYQHPEKLIPHFISRAINNLPLPVYRSSQNRREWIHVLDHCRAIEMILEKGVFGESYNVGTGYEVSVDEMANSILSLLNKPLSLKTIVNDRPSHDKRYLLDSSKITKELGWTPNINFSNGLADTVDWYISNKKWWEPLYSKLKIDESKW